MEVVQENFIYWFFIILMLIGLYGTIAKQNLMKKLMGLTIFQTAIILFYVSIGKKDNATIPVLLDADKVQDPSHIVDPSVYINPLPHVLMLTAIVVGVATVGVALSVLERLYAQYETLEEDEILEAIASS